MINNQSNAGHIPTKQRMRQHLGKSAVVFDIFSKSMWYTLLIGIVYTLALLLTSVVQLRSQTQLIMLFFIFYALNIAIIMLVWQQSVVNRSFNAVLQHVPLWQVLAIQIAIFVVSSLFMWAIGFIGIHTYGTWKFMANYMWNSYFGLFTMANKCGAINFVIVAALVPAALSILTNAKYLKLKCLAYALSSTVLILAIVSLSYGMVEKFVICITLFAIATVVLLATLAVVAIKGVQHERK